MEYAINLDIILIVKETLDKGDKIEAIELLRYTVAPVIYLGLGEAKEIINQLSKPMRFEVINLHERQYITFMIGG